MKITVSFALDTIKEVTGSVAKEVSGRQEVPTGTAYIYLVGNGENILQIGKSGANKNSKGRLVSLLKGSKPAIHNKSFLVGLAERIFSDKNKAYLFVSKTPEAHEKIIHEKLGVRTNRTACVFIDGKQVESMFEAQGIFFNRFIECYGHRYQDYATKINSFKMVYKIVQEGVKFTRSNGRPARYSSGDVLAGSNLRASGYLDLAKSWEEMTDLYFNYADYYQTAAFRSEDNKYPVVDLAKLKNNLDSAEDSKEEFLDLEVDLIVQNQQIVHSIDVLKKYSNELKTVKLYFQTNHENIVFEIEKPGNNPDKIRQILNATNGNDIIVSQLIATGHNTLKQYIGDDWGSCYYVQKATGYKNKGFNYIDRIGSSK